MAFPIGYILHEGFWYYRDGTGPFFFDADGTAIAIGGAAGGSYVQNSMAASTVLSPSVSAVQAALDALIARIVALEAGTSTPPPDSYVGNTGDIVYFPLPAGVLATIYVQRNGVDIAGAVSAPASNGISYTLVQADDQQPLTVRLTNITYDTVAPQRYSIQITDAERDTVEIVYGKTLQTTAISLAHFALSGTVATSKTLVSAIATNNVLKLKYSSAFVYGDTPALTLSTNGTNDFSDYAGNLVPTFTNLTIANNVERGVVPQFAPVNGFGNDGTVGYFNELGGLVAHTGTDYGYLLPMQSTASSSGTEWMYADGWVEMQCPDTSSVRRKMCMGPTTAANGDAKNLYQFWYENGTVQAVKGMDRDPGPERGYYNVSVGSPFTFPAPSASCWARLARIGDAVTVEYSTNNKTSWTVLYTFPNAQVDPLYAWLGFEGANVPIVAPGLVGFSPEGSVET